jgi:hypothetical protein
MLNSTEYVDGRFGLQYGNANISACTFVNNSCGDCSGDPGGGAITTKGTNVTLLNCNFIPGPASSPTAGHNDVFNRHCTTKDNCLPSGGKDNNNITVCCPYGTTGAPFVTAPGTLLSVSELPPTKKVVHCTAPTP